MDIEYGKRKEETDEEARKKNFLHVDVSVYLANTRAHARTHTSRPKIIFLSIFVIDIR